MPDDFLSITDHDVKDTNLLLRALRSIIKRLVAIGIRIDNLAAAPKPPSIRQIREELQVNGSLPLNVQALPGMLADPQTAKLTVYTAAPTGQILQQLRDGQIVDVAGATSDQLYRVMGGNPNTLVAITPTVTSASLPANVALLDRNTQTWTGTPNIFPAGTAAAPPIAFTGATTSGMYSFGANSLGLVTNGVGALYINSNQQVGLGQNGSARLTVGAGGAGSPTETLIIDGGSGAGAYTYLALARASVVKAYYGLEGSAGQLVAGTAINDVAFRAVTGGFAWSTDNGTSRNLILDTSGNLGIGGAPSNRLYVAGVTAGSPVEVINAPDTAGNPALHIALQRVGTTKYSIGLDASDSLNFTVGGTTEFALTSAGNVFFNGTIKERTRNVALGDWTGFTPTVTPSAGTWTAATYTTAQYMLVGKTLWIMLTMTGTTSAACTLGITVPNTYTSNKASTTLTRNNNGAAWSVGMAVTAAASTTITVSLDVTGANFPAAIVQVQTVMSFEIQ